MATASGSGGAGARRLKKAIEFAYYSTLRAMRGLFGLHTALKTPDRLVLDGVLLPALAADPEYRRVIFVGCDWYTRHYEGMFAGRDYWTIDMDPSRARYGAKQHLIGPMVDIGIRFDESSVDLIICNGVIGWGLNDPAQVDASLAACARVLRPRGVLLLGWNDIPEKRVVSLDSIPALKAFRPFAVAGQSVFRTATYNHHTFSLFEKVGNPAG
ncbi:MAG TPA: methyltransferase domain-containing protein [Vicinamibacteria bacterium]|nr:methyltransferase domain-containing protein [Vicinamibacteria bacterium]